MPDACPLLDGGGTRGTLRRHVAQPGDDIYLSGCTGEAPLALGQALAGGPMRRWT